jgi:ABC-type nickel/cobalt efflux system permease component RcnA
MNAIPLTLTISLCLVFTFLVFFLRENSRRRFSSAERESLLPLAEEIPHIVGGNPSAHDHDDDHDHDQGHGHGHDGCGCKDGSRPPCHGCLKGRR